MLNKQDILNAFRKKYKIDDDWDNELYQKIPTGYKKANPELEQWLLNTLTEFEREIYKEVDKKILKVIDARMEHVDDGIYDWKVNPKDTFFADDLKNELKNITFELEKEKR